MREEFLHYVWQYKLFSFDKLIGTNKEEIYIIKSGELNTNSGPDFLNAQLLIDGQKWVGNIEIHLKSSDWYHHNHEEDVNYDAVILHVVYEHDVTVFMKNNKGLPTLELCDKINKKLEYNYEYLSSNTKNWIPCEKHIASVNSFLFKNWLDRLYLERLEEKAILIKELLRNSENDYEAVLFQLLAKNFGLKVNGDAFLSLAQSIDFKVLRKERYDDYKLSALLFGQAGFLNDDIEGTYYLGLQKEYAFLMHKYKLNGINKNQFQFFRMRPSNFPTIRIAQLVALCFKEQNLFSKLVETEKLVDIYTLLSVEVSDFWRYHYTFETTSKSSPKKLTKSFINLLIINTIIPLRFVYGNQKGVENKDELLNLIEELPLEKNNVIAKFIEHKVIVETALESQALLHLKNNYCNLKKCLKCGVGNSLIRRIDFKY